MWDMLVLTILNLIRQERGAYVLVVIIVACAGALIMMARARKARIRERAGWLTPTMTLDIQHSKRIPHPELSIAPARTFDDSVSRLLPALYHTPSPISAPQWASAPLSSLLTPYSTFSTSPEEERERSQLRTEFGMATNSPNAPADESAPEDRLIPPIWRRIESLLEEHRAATLALTGEAPGEAAVIEPSPPIWRSVNTLRIEVAEIEGARLAMGQETLWESAPRPPIWRAVEHHERVGLALAFTASFTTSFTACGSEFSDEDVPTLRSSAQPVASAPPIWPLISGALPEAHTPPLAEDQTSADSRADWSEPPIWSSFMRQ